VTAGIATERLVELLPAWLPSQRWFRGKHRAILDVQTEASTTWHAGEGGLPRLEHLLAAVTLEGEAGEEVEFYQLLLGLRPTLAEHLEHAHIGVVDEGDGLLWVYDAIHDPELTGAALNLLATEARVAGVRFGREPGVRLAKDLVSRPVVNEQSNSSIIYADDYILKFFRRIEQGINPDLELHRLLRAAKCPHIAEPYGAIEGEIQGSPVTLGLLQQYFSNSAEGWAMATASVRDLLSEADLRADEVGGDFAAEATRMGEAVAAVHASLAAAGGAWDLSDEGFAALLAGMHRRLETAVSLVPTLADWDHVAWGTYAALAEARPSLRVQRIHGDLHLGQVLRTVTRWILIDFEGEPARPLAERALAASPLQDVAGMLRSLDYAAHHLMVDRDLDPQLEYRAHEWVARNREAFCHGYAAASGVDPADHALLLRALELDKAVYEVLYEFHHRPHWMEIPLRSIVRMAQQPVEGGAA
jgi:maltokinase